MQNILVYDDTEKMLQRIADLQDVPIAEVVAQLVEDYGQELVDDLDLGEV